jgi:hypothetical protein
MRRFGIAAQTGCLRLGSGAAVLYISVIAIFVKFANIKLWACAALKKIKREERGFFYAKVYTKRKIKKAGQVFQEPHGNNRADFRGSLYEPAVFL